MGVICMHKHVDPYIKIILLSFFYRVDQVYNLCLDFHLTPGFAANDKGTLAYPLYPYNDMEIVVFFLYEEKFTRRMNILLIPKSIRTLAGLIMSLVALATIVLCIIRRKLKLRRSGLIPSFIDTLTAFIGGGNVRMQHKIVKWFFGILWIAAFFKISVFLSDLVDYFTSILNQEVSTFEQLAQINPQFVVSESITQHRGRILEMFRCVVLRLLCV